MTTLDRGAQPLLAETNAPLIAESAAADLQTRRPVRIEYRGTDNPSTNKPRVAARLRRKYSAEGHQQ
jgi:hypothetical protein